MNTLRKAKSEKIYRKFLEKNKNICPFCEQELLINKYKYWILVENKFPYDKISEYHHLLATIREVEEFEDLKKEEITELKNIFRKLEKNYSYISLNVRQKRSIRKHFHFHLIKIK